MAMTFATDVTLNAGKVLQANTIKVPTASGGSTYGAGTANQAIMSNGSTVYWKKINSVKKTTLASISTLPKTYTVTGVTAEDDVFAYYLTDPTVMGSDWSFTTAANSITVSGTINGTTDLILWLVCPETLTATAN